MKCFRTTPLVFLLAYVTLLLPLAGCGESEASIAPQTNAAKVDVEQWPVVEFEALGLKANVPTPNLPEPEEVIVWEDVETSKGMR